MQTKLDRETMTQSKFWQRALAGGIGAHFDWLAACMLAGIGGSAFAPHGPVRIDDGYRAKKP
jgi:hypothetical protein